MILFFCVHLNTPDTAGVEFDSPWVMLQHLFWTCKAMSRPHPVILVHEDAFVAHHVGQLVPLGVVQHQPIVGVAHPVLRKPQVDSNNTACVHPKPVLLTGRGLEHVAGSHPAYKGCKCQATFTGFLATDQCLILGDEGSCKYRDHLLFQFG